MSGRIAGGKPFSTRLILSDTFRLRRAIENKPMNCRSSRNDDANKKSKQVQVIPGVYGFDGLGPLNRYNQQMKRAEVDDLPGTVQK